MLIKRSYHSKIIGGKILYLINYRVSISKIEVLTALMD